MFKNYFENSENIRGGQVSTTHSIALRNCTRKPAKGLASELHPRNEVLRDANHTIPTH
jgi:hypothetical protein